MSVPPARLAPPRSAPRSARTLWLEFKRNAVPYLLPLLAALFYFNTVRTADGYPPVWTVRASVITNDMVFEFGAFAAGLAAWAGSREGRRRTGDLVATTPRAVWARQSIALAGTLGWMLLAFLAGVAVLYIQTALQATWGGPPLWPVFVGAAGVTVTTVIGFAAGVFFPGRFTAPLAAILVFVLSQVGFREALGLTSASGTYALHSAASDQPVPYTPDCTSTSGFQVCVRPAFGFDLPNLTAVLDPVAAEIAGLPGAPVRAEELASTSGGAPVMSGIAGNPPVFVFTAEHVGNMFGEFNGYDPVGWHGGFQAGLLDAFLEEGSQQAGSLTPLDAAQQAVENGLLDAIGSPPSTTFGGMNMNGKVTTPQTAAEVTAATQRFAALSAGARHAWLAAHLAALRAGTVTLAQIP